jgi:copper chaperone CopZ
MAAFSAGCDYVKKTSGKMVRFRDDNKEVTYRVPALKSQECSGYLLDALRTVNGIQEASPDFELQQITIRYNSRNLGLKNIEYTISGAGFDVNDTPGDKKAKDRLPETCR